MLGLGLGLGLALALALGAAACDDRKPAQRTSGAGSAPAASTAAASGTATSTTVSAKLGCVPATVGGHTVVERAGHATIAAGGGNALVVTWRPSFTSLGGDALADVSADRLVLASDAKIAGPASPLGGRADGGAPRMTWAAAGSFKGQLAAITYGVSTPTAGGCADATLTIDPREGAPTVVGSDLCKIATSFAAAVRGDLALALLDGPTPGAKPAKPPGLDALVLADGKANAVRLEERPAARRPEIALGGATTADAGAGAGAGADAGAAAAAAGGLAVAVGTTWGAAAWIADAGGARELRIVGLDRTGAKTAPKILTLDKRLAGPEKGLGGPPALAFEGDVLHVVWAAQDAEGAPPKLRWTKWDGKGAPAPPQVLATGSAPAMAPALAVGPSGRFAIGWIEGGEGRTVVKAGTSRVNILAAVLGAATVSTSKVTARAPAVALDGDRAYVLWEETGPSATQSHATQLNCIE